LHHHSTSFKNLNCVVLTKYQRLYRYVRGLEPAIATEVHLILPSTCEDAMFLVER
jgi:hypothetical protein